MSLTSTEKKDNNIVELQIAVGGEELRAAADKVFRRKVKSINVPGFRKGKAPRSIIEKMYGEGVFLEDAVNDLYPAAYDDAVKEAGIEPVDRADVEILELDKETGFTFKATVTVKPEVSLGAYKGIEAEKIITTATDKDIDEEIGRMRDRNSRMITVEGRAAVQGDAVVIDFDGYVDGEAFDGGKGDGYRLTLGSGQFIPGFEDQVIGHESGDEFDVNVTFPEEYHAEALAGKAAVFKVKLHEITAKELPELDDEFAKDVSEFDTLEELRGDIRAKRQEQLDSQADDGLENALLDKVIETVEADIPECMFENRINGMMRDYERRLSGQGLQLDRFLQYTGMDMDAFRASFREEAVRQVKIQLALEKIAELEAFEVTEDDIAEQKKKLAEAYGTELENIDKFVPEKDIVEDIRRLKAVDLVRDSAVVTEKAAEEEAGDSAEVEK